jgi:hypothetical protein
MELGGWLRSLGLGQYEAAFRENAIDDTVVPKLTTEYLQNLGVNIVGHRRKLLNAIAAFRADVSTKTPPPDVLPATDRTVKDSAERRFSDLEGSIALAARMRWRPCILRLSAGARGRRRATGTEFFFPPD